MERLSKLSTKNSINFLSEEKDFKVALPPLVNRNDSIELTKDDTKLSITSNSSSTFFPKISNRYLPK